jgi:hypothetical protein
MHNTTDSQGCLLNPYRGRSFGRHHGRRKRGSSPAIGRKVLRGNSLTINACPICNPHFARPLQRRLRLSDARQELLGRSESSGEDYSS